MIDLDDLAKKRAYAERDKAELFDFYHKYWDQLVDAYVKSIELKDIAPTKEFVKFVNMSNTELMA